VAFLNKVIQESDFESSIESLTENTRNGIQNTINHFSKYCESQGSTKEEAIEEMQITKNKKEIFRALQGFVNFLAKNGIASSSIPIMFSHLRAYLYHHNIPITDQDRKHEIKYPKIIEDEKHGLEVEEFKKLLHFANPKKKALYFLMLASALRIGEVVQLRKNDLKLIDKDHFMITVRGITTKTGKGRITFIGKEAKRYVFPFWKQANDNDFIFATCFLLDRLQHQFQFQLELTSMRLVLNNQ